MFIDSRLFNFDLKSSRLRFSQSKELCRGLRKTWMDGFTVKISSVIFLTVFNTVLIFLSLKNLVLD